MYCCRVAVPYCPVHKVQCANPVLLVQVVDTNGGLIDDDIVHCGRSFCSLHHILPCSRPVNHTFSWLLTYVYSREWHAVVYYLCYSWPALLICCVVPSFFYYRCKYLHHVGGQTIQRLGIRLTKTSHLTYRWIKVYDWREKYPTSSSSWLYSSTTPSNPTLNEKRKRPLQPPVQWNGQAPWFCSERVSSANSTKNEELITSTW